MIYNINYSAFQKLSVHHFATEAFINQDSAVANDLVDSVVD